MERRGRASDCQRSYDFTQNDLPPPLTGRRHTPDATSTARRLVQSGRHSARRCCSLGRRWRCLPLSPLRRRDPPQAAYSTRAVQCASRIRGASQCYIWVRFVQMNHLLAHGIGGRFSVDRCIKKPAGSARPLNRIPTAAVLGLTAILSPVGACGFAPQGRRCFRR